MFTEDLKKGEQVEDLFIEALKKRFPARSVFKGRVGEKSFDICVEFPNYRVLYEVKADFLSVKTGNIALEYTYKGQKSGIAVTKANYWVQLVGQKFYVFDVNLLRNELRANWSYYKKVRGGDNQDSCLVLLPLKRVNNFHFLEVW